MSTPEWRKFLRSLTPQRMVEYVQQSQALFAKTTDEVVTVVPGESVRLG